VLIEELEAKRKELSLSDAAFARRLGVSRPLWIAVRERKRSVGMTLLRGAAREFPDLDGALLAHLRGEEMSQGNGGDGRPSGGRDAARPAPDDVELPIDTK
jgi:transcriptional regulator with XRE-family HTH domain